MYYTVSLDSCISSHIFFCGIESLFLRGIKKFFILERSEFAIDMWCNGDIDEFHCHIQLCRH